MTAGPHGDGEVPAFWRGLGLPGLADIHVHFLPPRILQRMWLRSDEDSLAGGLLPAYVYRWSDEERVAHLRELGVRAFTALAYAHQPGMADGLNAWTMDFAAHNDGCVPSATFYPEPGVNRYTKAALDGGARVFKVHVPGGGFDLTHARLDPIWGMLAEVGTPVVIHVNSLREEGRLGSLDPLEVILRRHPTLAAVIAHLGAPDYEHHVALAQQYERVCLDTAAIFTPGYETASGTVPGRLLPQLRDLGLAGKVLLGSDFPTMSYPYAEQLAGLAALDLGDDWLRAVCWYNAARLLQLE
ncbi:amidohydrolase family protein [Luedemannella helvata]|uniref:Amidohydrolase family protein n=1 Tax=Luedemannella helvata TaxID=349315 RepID=A0ABN2JY08_9ACTN